MENFENVLLGLKHMLGNSNKHTCRKGNISENVFILFFLFYKKKGVQYVQGDL